MDYQIQASAHNHLSIVQSNRHNRRMYRWSYILMLLAALGLEAAVTVNTPQTTTNRVFINVIQFATSTGIEAQDFGSPSQETYIKEQTDLILNQAGIDVAFSPVITVVDDFAYDGSPNDYNASSRPQNDLGDIRSNTSVTPNFSDARVINLYLVEIVPGFSSLSNNSANGLAYIDGNGIAMHIGSNLVGFQSGRDVIASVLAHEIGHNLGLSHTPNNTANLMSPGGSSEQLTEDQIGDIFTNSFGIDGYDFAKSISNTDFNAYLSASGLSGGENGDEDFDGLPNLLEFALGTDPAIPDRSRLSAQQQVAAGSITLDYRKQASALEDGVDYSLEYTSDLNSPWEDVGIGSSGSTLIENTNERIAGTNNNGDTEFMRLRITRTAPAVIARSASVFNAAPLAATQDQQPADAPIADCTFHRSITE